MKSVALIANPAAGSHSRRALHDFADLLLSRGARVSHHATDAVHGAEQAVDEAAGADIVVAAGGDGTLHAVANALQRLGTGSALAFFPSGTANVFAHEARLPSNRGELAGLFLSATPQPYPLGFGRLHDAVGRPIERSFLLMAGVGWDASLILDLPPRLKRLLGRTAFALSALATLPRRGRGGIELVAGGERAVGEQVIVANSPFYAGPFRVVPRARAADPELSAAVIRRIGLLTAGPLLIAALRGREDRSGATVHLRGESLEVPTPGIPVQMDGEIVGFTPARFTKLHPGLRVIMRDRS